MAFGSVRIVGMTEQMVFGLDLQDTVAQRALSRQRRQCCRCAVSFRQRCCHGGEEWVILGRRCGAFLSLLWQCGPEEMDCWQNNITRKAAKWTVGFPCQIAAAD